MPDAPAGRVAPGPFLPPGPYRVVRGYVGRRTVGAWVLRVLTLAMLVGGGLLMQKWVGELRHDAALWDDPQAIEVPAEFRGRVQSRLGMLPTYRGKVGFRLDQGGWQEGTIEFSTLLEVDDHAPTTVRVRPDAPQDFVFSWAATSLGSRWAMTGLMGAVFLLVLPASLWFFARHTGRRAELARCLAIEGEEHLLPVVGITEQKHYGKVRNRTFTVQLVGDGKPREVGGTFAAKHQAFLVGGSHALVVTSPLLPGDGIVLRADLWPLDLPPEAVAAARQRADAAGTTA